MNSQITYAAIESLVKSAEIEGDTLHCVFECPNTGQAESTKIAMKTANKESIVSSAVDTAQTRMARSLKRGILSGIASAFGTGTVGTVARQAAGQMVDKASKNRVYSEAEKQRAVVIAFEKTKAFVYDEESQTYVHSSAERAGSRESR